MNSLEIRSVMALILIALSTQVNASDDYTKVLMLSSLHTKGGYDDHNHGFGIEHEGVITLGAYIYNNSYSKSSLMLSVNKEFSMTSNVLYSIGIAVANNYDDNPFAKNGFLGGVEFGITYKSFRVKTSGGTASMVGATDVFNFQYIWRN